MSAHTYPVSVTFHDVAACFSAEEWAGLEVWKKELYKKVMLEIHSALEAMGFEILNREVLFCIKKVKDLYIDICETDRTIHSAASFPRDPGRMMGLKQERGAPLDSCQKKAAKSNAHQACSPDLLLRIKSDEQAQQSPAHSRAEPIVTSVFSLQQESEELHPAERSSMPAHRRLTSQTIKQEKVDYVKVSVGGNESNGITAPPAGRLPSQLMKCEDEEYMKVSVGGAGSDAAGATCRGPVTTKPIKQEEPEYVKVSVGGQVPVNTTAPSRADTGEPLLHICDTASPSHFPMTPVSNSLGSQSTPSPIPGAPRLRIVKFTEKELDVLVDLVIENYSKLFGNEADITPSMAKNSMWQAIANEVSAVGVASRTSDKVKKRWKDAKRKMNEKLSEAAAHVAETGRRPPPHLRLAPYEQRLRDFFKPEYSKEVDWNQDKEDLPEEVEAEPIECGPHPEAAGSFSPPCQDAAEDSSKDSSEEPSVISPDSRPHPSDIMEEREMAAEPEPERQERQQFSAISSTLHNLTSHQRESNLLMQEQNAILSQIAYSLNLLQIQQTDGLAALGSIIQRGIEVIRPAACVSPSDRTAEHPNVHAGLRRPVTNLSNADQPVPPKRKIT